jgi:hypothetical protein
LAVDDDPAVLATVARNERVVERTYFDRVAGEAEDRLGAHEEPVLAAADAYSYLKAAVGTSPSRLPLVCLPAGRRRSAAVNA